MDNSSAFSVSQYDGNIRKVIPYYDEIRGQIFDLIKTHTCGRETALLDTGCGTGTLGLKACQSLKLSRLVLCDQSEKMLAEAKKKLEGKRCEFICAGSERLGFDGVFDVVTAIQSHHYFDRNARETAVGSCFRALKKGGIFICFENTAPFTEKGRKVLLRRLEACQISSGRTPEEAASHIARYGREFFPISISEHLELLNRTGFEVSELFWHSYMQSGFYGIKKRGVAPDSRRLAAGALLV